MITHTDFDYAVWANNLPNTIITQSEAREMGYSTSNDHQRMTIVHADNDDDSGSWTGSYHSRSTLTTDLYPYKKNDSLTAYSAPATTLYHTNKQGTRLLQGAILNIRQNLDGTIDFDYRAKGGSKPQDEPDNGILFYESFDQCNGTGGNDGQWSNRIATSILKTDNDGWDALYGRGANLCARFGSTATVGMATTPSFNIDGEATLTFLAAPWVSTSDGTELQLLISSTSGDAPSISPSGFNMKKGEWTACEATISGKGAVKVTFLPDLRFFLDEVKVVKKSTAAITPLPSPTTHHPSPIYSLDGRYQGTSKETLRPGLYISQGQKIIIK